MVGLTELVVPANAEVDVSSLGGWAEPVVPAKAEALRLFARSDCIVRVGEAEGGSRASLCSRGEVEAMGRNECSLDRRNGPWSMLCRAAGGLELACRGSTAMVS